MMPDPAIEEHIRELRERGEFAAAASYAVRFYGPELLGFLLAILRNEDLAQEAFAQGCEDMWRAFPRFEGRCTTRVWFYTLARHAAARMHRSPHRRHGRHVGLSDIPLAAEHARTATLPHLRTEAKRAVAAIRDGLSEEDQTLLVLRVDRAMSWNDVARVLSAPETSEDELRSSAARLRKQFQALKNKIRFRAREAGLLDEVAR